MDSKGTGGVGDYNSSKKSLDRQRLVENGKKKQPLYGEFSDIPKDSPKPEPKSVSIRELFRFASKWDMLLYMIAVPCALVNGGAWPFMLVIMGDTVSSLVTYRYIDQLLDRSDFIMEQHGWTRENIFKHVDEFIPLCPNISRQVNYTALNCSELEGKENIFDDMKDQAAKYAYIGVAVLTCAMLQVIIFITTSERQVIRMRKAFYRNILRQDMAWFDKHSAGALTVKMTEDIHYIHDAIGDKTGTSLQWFGAAVSGLTIAFSYGWKLTLVMISAAPALAISFGIVAKVTGDMTAQEREAYGHAGAVAEEVFSSMRTVTAFGGQEKEAERYKQNLVMAQKFGIKKGRWMGMSIGTAWFIIYCFLATGFYYGGKLVREGEYAIEDMMVVFLAALIGSFSIGLASPAFGLVKVGCGAAYEVFKIIDAILDGFNLTVSPGQTVALVGHSGCGKSTVTQLLMRFYDVDSGQVTLDGVNVKDLNVKHLRQHIGIVSQEPVLFPTTIAENIRYGRNEVTKQEIIDAAKKANAYNFIMSMPDGFNCFVGERGTQLSGGQKQRIAIARSLVREPCVLLLDEATSALDRNSEAIVQDALDKASIGRTTLVIAHRLSTIKHADIIVVMDKGRVVEKGNHNSLLADKGIYYNLVNTQKYDGQENEGTENAAEKVVNGTRRNSDVEATLSRHLSFTEDEEEESKLLVSRKDALKRLSRLTAPEWAYNLVGAFASLFNGAIQPWWGFLLAETIVAFTKDDEDEEKDEIMKISLYCLGLAVAALFSYTAQYYFFSVSGERLIGRIRSIAFKAMLRQEIGWFDDEKHQSGALGAQLAEKATLVKGAIQSISSTVLLSIGALTAAFTICFIFSWKLTLLCAAFVPLVIMSGLLTVKENQGMSKTHKTTLEEASNDAMSAVANIKTVASLTTEELFLRNFCDNLDDCFKFNTKKTITLATGLAISCASYYFTFSACFYYGSVLLEDNDIGAVDIFRIFNAVVLSSVQLGRMIAVSPDTKGALTASRQIFQLEDSVPAIDSYSKEGNQPDPKSVHSTVRFSDVHFRYPMRPDVKVLKGLDLQVDSGETLALVGESGSGKSTVVQLLERFYQTGRGNVYMDQHNITDLNVQWLRQQIGLVSQEPVLFDKTIGENIAYGDNSRDVSMDEIITAARAANIHNFIQSLPLGYDTNVGNKGTQLSGGQKQRIAIARALVRNPKILLLDEATSALDAESEKVVQEALDRAREGRTCITIAHRLSTIKNANKIAVIRNGVVHEQGTHSQLMNMQGLYYRLQTQS